MKSLENMGNNADCTVAQYHFSAFFTLACKNYELFTLHFLYQQSYTTVT